MSKQKNGNGSPKNKRLTANINQKTKKGSKNGKNKSKRKTPLKISKLGFEAEFLILDENGKPANRADFLLEKVIDKKDKIGAGIRKECGKNMIEVGSYPKSEMVDTAKTFIENLKTLLYVAEKEKLVICPLGSYPAKFMPEMRTDEYRTAHILFGRNFVRAGRVFGYHCHYALPRGVFDNKKLMLKTMIDSKIQKTLIDSYNFLIAADPALITFMQSSPFYQGYYLSKDSRVLAYRRDSELKPTAELPFALHFDSPLAKILPAYEHTTTDLINFIKKLYEERVNDCRGAGLAPKYRSMLSTNWSPVRISSRGTLEQRGMDMNHLVNIMSVSYIIKSTLRAIQGDFLEVKISEKAIKNPFQLDKKTIYIPPYSYVRKNLQRASVFKGLEDGEVLNYCKKLFSLAETFIVKKKRALIEPLEKMLQDKKTISDEIIAEAKKLGHKDLKKEIPQNIAAQIALNHSKRLFKEIILVQKFVEELS